MCCNEILNINLQNSDALTARVCLRRPTAKVKSMHAATAATAASASTCIYMVC